MGRGGGRKEIGKKSFAKNEDIGGRGGTHQKNRNRRNRRATATGTGARKEENA